VPKGPTITAIDPEEGEAGVAPSTNISIRVTDKTEVDVSTLLLSVSGITYVRDGVAINGASLTSAPNAQNGFDAQVDLPDQLAIGIIHDVNATVINTLLEQSIKQYTFQVGGTPRLLQVRNPCEGVLIAFFSQAMRHNSEFLSPANWKIVPISEGAKPLTVFEVVANSTQPDQAILRYRGGGSTYEITTFGLVGASGQTIEVGFDSVLFDIIFDEQEVPTIRLFDTVFGVVGVSQFVATRRTMDGHVAGRSIALGLDEQFRLKLQTLDGSAGRTGKPGIRRT
jgi:hypothetical protein